MISVISAGKDIVDAMLEESKPGCSSEIVTRAVVGCSTAYSHPNQVKLGGKGSDSSASFSTPGMGEGAGSATASAPPCPPRTPGAWLPACVTGLRRWLHPVRWACAHGLPAGCCGLPEWKPHEFTLHVGHACTCKTTGRLRHCMRGRASLHAAARQAATSGCACGCRM